MSSFLGSKIRKHLWGFLNFYWLARYSDYPLSIISWREVEYRIMITKCHNTFKVTYRLWKMSELKCQDPLSALKDSTIPWQICTLNSTLKSPGKTPIKNKKCHSVHQTVSLENFISEKNQNSNSTVLVLIENVPF